MRYLCIILLDFGCITMVFERLRRVPITYFFFGLITFACAVIFLLTNFLTPVVQQQQHPKSVYQQHGRSVSYPKARDLQDETATVLQPYIDADDFFGVHANQEHQLTKVADDEHIDMLLSECTFASCFNISKCTADKLTVFVYPASPHHHPVTPMYQQILNVIRDSTYFTKNPDDACLFVPGFDTLSRDDLSEHVERDVANILMQSPDYVRWWQSGRNHLLFNFYAGTFPDYAENDIRMNAGYAMLAKASISLQHMRYGFDISMPLPPDNWPIRIRDELPSHWTMHDIKANFSRKMLLSFKGKRYVHGIGSESRDTLHLLHDPNDNVVLVTTCRHGKNWQRLKDDRCDMQEQEYVQYDYKTLLTNSTFCLVPRGRRLGSYRFLEVLQAGCIPVVLSNEWILPFADELIDWSGALLVLDERIIFELPEYLRAFTYESHSNFFSGENRNRTPLERIVKMREQGKFIYSSYLSSLEKIVLSVLRIIDERIAVGRVHGSTHVPKS